MKAKFLITSTDTGTSITDGAERESSPGKGQFNAEYEAEMRDLHTANMALQAKLDSF